MVAARPFIFWPALLIVFALSARRHSWRLTHHPTLAISKMDRQQRFTAVLDTLARIAGVNSAICPSGWQHQRYQKQEGREGPATVVHLLSTLLGVTADLQRLSLALGSRVARGRDNGDIGGGGGEKEEKMTKKVEKDE